jgi:hypothetical protein
MAGKHKVEDGDSIPGLAARNGLLPETLWGHPDNAKLKEKRGSSHVLLDGEDEVFVPDVRSTRSEAVPIDQRTTFRRKAVTETLRVCFRDAKGKPRVGLDYLFEVEGEQRHGQTKEGGLLEEWVPPTARRAEVTLRDGDVEEHYALLLSHLDPPDEVWGAQQRLMSLGYDCGDEYGAPGEKTDRALRAFQRAHGLRPTGTLDAQTRERLEKEYRS